LIGLFCGDFEGRQIEYVVVVVVFRIEYFLVIKGYNPQLGEKAPLPENYYYRLPYPSPNPVSLHRILIPCHTP
tara:strand:+ start:76 stop:294 length:219 start_codon:yes stop_codon:yes gene_type:complete